MQYCYKALNLKGEEIKGNIKAQSEFDVFNEFRTKGYFLVYAKKRIFAERVLKKEVNLRDISFFSIEVSTLLSSGISIIKALNIVKNELKNKYFKNEVNKVILNIEKGMSLSESFKNCNIVFPQIFINSIEIGEKSGNIDETFLKLSKFFNQEFEIRKKIKKAVSYPIFILLFSQIMFIFLIVYIVPIFISTLKNAGGNLTLSLRIIEFVSVFVKNNYIVLIAVFLLMVFGMFICKNRIKKVLYKTLSKVPLINDIVKDYILSKLLKELGMLLFSGINLCSAIEIVYNANNLLENSLFKNCLKNIKRGESVAESFEKTGEFKPFILSMIKVGEETGKLDEMFMKCSGYLEGRVINFIEYCTKYIEPILIILTSVIVGFVLVTFVVPLFDMMDSL